MEEKVYLTKTGLMDIIEGGPAGNTPECAFSSGQPGLSMYKMQYYISPVVMVTGCMADCRFPLE